MANTLIASETVLEASLKSFDIPDNLSSLWTPKFPSADLVDAAASLLPDQKCGQLEEGPSWRISVSPGKVKLWTKDEAKAERTENRLREARIKTADAYAAFLASGDEIPADPEPTRVIHEWSRKSRSRMVEALCDLDYEPFFGDPSRLLAMLTLTYPGAWLEVAPNGQEVKRHLKMLRKRYKRAYGEDLLCIWKLEFQRRGAPHVHMLMRPPHQLVDGKNFRDWLSRVWVEIVNHSDSEERRRHLLAGTGLDFNEGLRGSDPRRVAVYFTKHGAYQAKNYQNQVPKEWQEPGKGPGRFWGYWGLQKKIATVSVSVKVGTEAGRILRRYSRAQQVTQLIHRPRVKNGRRVESVYPEVIGLAGKQLLQAHRVHMRPTRVRAIRMKNGRGWISVNSGPALVTALAFALHKSGEEANRAPETQTPLARAYRLSPGPRRDSLIKALLQKG